MDKVTMTEAHALQFQGLLSDVPDSWRKHGYKSEAEEIADMANIGRALMEALPEGYSYMNCPSEIVSDLQNERDEARATPAPDSEKLREAKDRYRQALDDICNPLAYLQRIAEADGNRLGGMAYMIANDPATLQRIARQALGASA